MSLKIRFEKVLDEVIKKVGSKWQVQSHKGKNLGTSDTKAGAVKRLRQVEYFKNHSENEEKAVINTMMAGLNEKDIFEPAEPEEIENRNKEFTGKFPIGTTVKLKFDEGFYDYETDTDGTTQKILTKLINKGTIGKIIALTPNEPYATVEFPDGSAGILSFNFLDPVNEDIFKPAKKGEVNKRQKRFESSVEKSKQEWLDIASNFYNMYEEFTRDDEDPPEYLTDLYKEMRQIGKEIIPEDPEGILDVVSRARELLKQLRVFVTGEDI
jgi:hypothetical protein